MNASRSARRSLLLLLPVLAWGLLGSPALAQAATPFELSLVPRWKNHAVGSDVSLALDAEGNPHITHVDKTVNDLIYSTRIDGKWTQEIVDSGTVSFSSIALDAAGDPHIAYCDLGNTNLKYATRVGDGPWILETVDSSADVGRYPSIVLDAYGRPHISYYDLTNGNLKYARKESNLSWTIQTVDVTGDVGLFTSIDLDPSGLAHIAYQDFTNLDLKYARDLGGFWTTETVDSFSSAGHIPSLVIDSAGNSHVSYMQTTDHFLKYAIRSPDGTWRLKILDNTLVGYGPTSIGLDSRGNVHIAYYDNGLGTLRYARQRNGLWEFQSVPSSLDIGTYLSMALDTEGHPHIAYRYNNEGLLGYADSYVTLASPTGGERWTAGSEQVVRWIGLGAVSIGLSSDGGATYRTVVESATGESATIHVPDWTTGAARVRLTLLADPTFTSDSPGTFTIAPDLTTPWWMDTPDTVSNAGYTTDLALDPQGLAHITHFSFTTQRLRYLSQTGGGAWSVEIPDTALGSGGYSSLVFDRNGDPHISHWNYYQQTLWYSVRTGGTWSNEVVDPGPGNVGVGCSLALLDGTTPYVSYEDNTNGTLKVAHKDGGWILEVVDPSGDVGEYTSLALDSSGNPHVAYYDQFTRDLRYAYRLNGSYVIEVPDAVGDVGDYASLALDVDDIPHIAYYDATWSDLKYATKRNGSWIVERVDTKGDQGTNASIALDPAGNPVIAYFDADAYRMKVARRIGGSWSIEYAAPLRSGEFNSVAVDKQGNIHAVTQDADHGAIRYVSSAIELTSPAPGEVWPVGSSRVVRWNGTGRVDVSLSVDGGNSFQSLATGVTGGSYGIVVPHRPSAFTQVRVERALPRSTSSTPGLFTIETDIVLLMLSASPPEAVAPAGGAVISWATDPGPEDLGGYRLEKRSGGSWSTLAAGITKTSFFDATASPGAEYRLFGINGLGEELELGEVRFGTSRPLLAGPLPYRGGDLRVSFATFGGLSGGFGPAEVVLFDLQGRRVRTIASGSYPAGVQDATWDGKDESGRPVASGVYFLRSVTGGESNQIKLVVVR